jgi:hypothetical protein
MIKPGIDIDGVAQTELDHFGNCPVCGALVDMRDLAQVLRTFTKRRLRSAKVPSRRQVPASPEGEV